MNIKRYIGAAVALMIFIFFYSWAVHGILLGHMYHETAQLWRTLQEMTHLRPLLFAYQILISLWFTFVFSKLQPKGGVENGLRIGLYFGLFAAICSSSAYIWLPISGMLALSWFCAALIQWLVAGAIVGKIYHK